MSSSPTFTVPKAPRRGDLDGYIDRARRAAHELMEHIDAFHGRTSALRDVAANDEADLRKRDAELAIAGEELRAQNEALRDAITLLERERAKYLDLFENAPDAYVVTDGRGVISEGNLAAATLLGMPRSALPGLLLIAFVARRDTRPFRERLWQLDEQDGQGTFPLQLRVRGGDPFRAWLSVRRVRIPSAERYDLRWTIRTEPGDH